MDEIAAQPISIFDLDRTITRDGTWSPFLVFASRRLSPWRLLLAPAALGAMIGYKVGLLNRKRLKEVMQFLMIGGDVRRVPMARVANAFADRCMLRQVYPEAIELIRAEQAAGRRVILATAAHHFYLDSLAERLGIGEVIATGSVWANDRLKARIVGQNCYGSAKRDMIAAFAAEQAIDRSRTHIRFYSDHISDLPSFTWADEAIAVNPSRPLARHAALMGWPVIDWRQKARRRKRAILESRLPDASPISSASPAA